MALSPWAKALVPSLTQKLGALGVPASAIPAFAAQLDIETAGGTSYGVRKRNNVAGIGGLGNYKVYGSIEQGLDDYVSLLSRKYKNVMAAGRSGDPAAVAKALGNSPWAEHRYRLGASGKEGQAAGRVGTEGQAILAKLGGARSIGGNVDRSQTDYAEATPGATTGAGTSAMPSMQPTDIMTIMQQALGLVGGAQGAAGSIPDFTGYLDALAQQREDSLKAEMASLDTLVAQARDRLRTQLAGSQSALPGMAQAAGKDFSAIGAQLPGMQDDGTHGASVASLQALGVDPSAYSRQVAGNTSGMAAELGGAQQYMSTLSAGVDDSIRNQMSQLMTATQNEAVGDLETVALKAKLAALQQSNQTGYQTASDFAKTRYGAEVNAQSGLTGQILQAMSTIGSLAQGNASQRLQAAEFAARLRQYATENRINLEKLALDRKSTGLSNQLTTANIAETNARTGLLGTQTEAAKNPQSSLTYSEQQKAKLDAAAKKRYDSMNSAASAYAASLMKQFPQVQAAHEIEPKNVKSGELTKFIPLLASTSGAAEASAWLTKWYEKNLSKIKGESKPGRAKRVTTSVNAAMKDYNGLVQYKNGG